MARITNEMLPARLKAALDVAPRRRAGEPGAHYADLYPIPGEEVFIIQAYRRILQREVIIDAEGTADGSLQRGNRPDGAHATAEEPATRGDHPEDSRAILAGSRGRQRILGREAGPAGPAPQRNLLVSGTPGLQAGGDGEAPIRRKQRA